MNERDTRLRVIRTCINSSRISSQSQLLQKLEDKGVTITQATLSRDLKALKVTKIPDKNGAYYFAVSRPEQESVYVEDFRRGYRSLTFSANIGVLKTLTGHADAVAMALDRMEFPEILGTIAGDDTILIVLGHPSSADSLSAKLKNMISDLEI